MRLYFDECCSRRLPRELKEFYATDYPNLETCHVLDFYNPSTGDSTWLKPLEDDKTWVVITSDMGRDARKEKLPVICKELGITHIAMTSALIRAGYTTQKTALVTIWTQLMQLHQLPPGTQVKLGRHQIRGGFEKFALRVAGKPIYF